MGEGGPFLEGTVGQLVIFYKCDSIWELEHFFYCLLLFQSRNLCGAMAIVAFCEGGLGRAAGVALLGWVEACGGSSLEAGSMDFSLVPPGESDLARV